MEPIVTGGSGGKGNCEKMVYSISYEWPFYYYFRMKFPFNMMIWSFCHAAQNFKSKQFVFWERESGEKGREARVWCKFGLMTQLQRLLPPSSHLFESDKWHRGCNFSFYKYPIISWQIVFHGVWWLWAATTAVYKVFRKVLSSVLLKNPWHGERRTCKATYCTYFTYDDHWQQKDCVRYVNEQAIVRERQGALGRNI